MSSVKDHPKVPADLKCELASLDPSKLKHTETQEKNTLPSKEDVKQERDHFNLIQGVEHFEKKSLHHTETTEKVILPNAEDVAQEKVFIHRGKVLEGVTMYDKSQLTPTETKDKTKDVLEQERVLVDIQKFDHSKLKPTETQEKNPLPTKEVIDQEKGSLP